MAEHDIWEREEYLENAKEAVVKVKNDRLSLFYFIFSFSFSFIFYFELRIRVQHDVTHLSHMS